MIRLAAVEMTIAYAAFVGFVPLLLFSSAAHKRSIAFLCCFALPILCLLGITIPNVGTLLRMRYGYWYVMMGLGVIGWSLAMDQWRGRKAVKAEPSQQRLRESVRDSLTASPQTENRLF
jgi:hypothetical protein